MHGTLRFFLAITVALSHLGLTIYTYNPGVIAVVMFYLLAGMVAYKLNSKKFPNKAFLYYKDRIKRIFPTYFMVLIFAFVIYLLGAKSYFISAVPTISDYLSNIVIIPLSYYMYNNIDKFTLLPPVWSLGVELQFYILAPFILLNNKIIKLSISLSLFIYILAVVGLLNTDYFAYRLIPGVLFIFLIGAIIQKVIEGDLSSKKILFYLYLLLLFLLGYVYFIDYKAPYNYETLFGLILGIPILLLLSSISLSNYKVVDKYLGNISYPIFLLHFPILWLFELFIKNPNNYYIILATLLLSILLQNILEKLKLI
ncbi:acyltransferase family protein [Poseidonibacter antarcticus]|uniref:acyltransferase family protein n=1 Tax=Poseidonibacter antarcticus TaxID=2478538 RepID=UPI000EF4E933|nr:acyltransferase [Poseidonibacter antarcticus]